jgi:hypothetical protein
MASLRYGEELVLKATALSGHPRDGRIFHINSKIPEPPEPGSVGITFKSKERYFIGIVKSGHHNNDGLWHTTSYSLFDNYGHEYGISYVASSTGANWTTGYVPIYGKIIPIDEPTSRSIHPSLSSPLPECVIDYIKDQCKKGRTVDIIGLLTSSIMKSYTTLADTNEKLKTEIAELKLERANNIFETTIELTELQRQFADLKAKYETDSRHFINAITALNMTYKSTISSLNTERKTENIIYLSDTFSHIHTMKGELLNLNNRICMVEIPSKHTFIYFKLISETETSFSGIRLQQDTYDNKKFYLTNERNKWHGIISDGAFTKGRWIYVFN